MTDERLIADMLDLAAIKAPEVANWATDKQRAAFAAFSMGAQWALELAALDHEVARRLITAIHASQTADTAPEWNRNAMAFLQRAHYGEPPPAN